MKRIIMSNYDKFIDGKHRNGGAYGYDTVFTLREDGTYERVCTSTSELSPDEITSGWTADKVGNMIANFINWHVIDNDCRVVIDGVTVWHSYKESAIEWDEPLSMHIP